MGLLPQCTIHKFLDDPTGAGLEGEIRMFLGAFFEATRARTAQRFAGAYLISEATARFPRWLIRPEEIPEDERMVGIDRDLYARAANDERYSKATREYFAHLAQGHSSLAIGAGTVSGGMSFGLDKESNRRSWWDLNLYRGPLPILELLSYHGYDFKPLGGWERSLFANGEAVHVLWMDARAGAGVKRYWGAGGNIYLLKKRQDLLPVSKGDSGEEAIKAGRRLRDLCRIVWRRQRGNKAGLYKLSSLDQKRFMQRFDKALLDEVGAEKLAVLLEMMGTSLDHWLRSAPSGSRAKSPSK
ncbi:MAG: hypothetical protein ABSG14_04965 [Verrucomicrobiia bacterium]|jgi:hypothetical protein